MVIPPEIYITIPYDQTADTSSSLLSDDDDDSFCNLCFDGGNQTPTNHSYSSPEVQLPETYEKPPALGRWDSKNTLASTSNPKPPRRRKSATLSISKAAMALMSSVEDWEEKDSALTSGDSEEAPLHRCPHKEVPRPSRGKPRRNRRSKRSEHEDINGQRFPPRVTERAA